MLRDRGTGQDAADLMQDAFLKLWERWDRGRPDRRSTGVPVPRGAQRVPEAGAHRTPGRAEVGTRSASSHDPFDEVNLREDVRQMLLGLSPRQRAALVLLDLYGYGSQEAARIMGIRPSTVRALATQGRAVLRQGGPNA